MTLLKILQKLKKHNKGNYNQFILCFLLSILLTAALGIFITSPFVQSRIPVGGDSRKMLYMVSALAIIGCIMFTIYATGLFLRFKSREIGVLMALGTEKSLLTKTLMKEIGLLISQIAVIGILLGILLAFGVGKLYEFLIQSVEGDYFNISMVGILYSLLFFLVAGTIIMMMTIKFMRRINIIEILNEEKRTEPIKKNVDKKYFSIGLFFILIGIFGGLIVPFLVATIWKVKLGAFMYAFYLLVLIGLYRIMVYSISVHKRGRNPQKYYKNLISFGMMKFQGVSVVRNMLIVTLLLAGALYAVFFTMTNYMQGSWSAKTEANDFSYRYLGDTEGLTEEDVTILAKEHGVSVQNYREAEFIRLLASGVCRDNYDDNGKLIEQYREKDYYKNFISMRQFKEVTGIDIDIQQGTYQYITKEGNTENYWFSPEDMDLAQNTDTGVKVLLKYGGTVAYSSFFYNRGMDGNSVYIINDVDYANLKEGISQKYMLKHILFDVSESENNYGFAKKLYEAYCNSVSDSMRTGTSFDEYRANTDMDYGYASSTTLYPQRPEIQVDWKYSPVFVPLQEKIFMLSYATLLLVFLFVALICLVAAGVIVYARSITVALKSKCILNDVKKLGAERNYLDRIIKEQIKKIFILPTLLAIAVMFTYYTLTLWQNDGIFTEQEYLIIAINVVICVAVGVYQYILYRCSLKKSKAVIYDSELVI